MVAPPEPEDDVVRGVVRHLDDGEQFGDVDGAEEATAHARLVRDRADEIGGTDAGAPAERDAKAVTPPSSRARPRAPPSRPSARRGRARAQRRGAPRRGGVAGITGAVGAGGADDYAGNKHVPDSWKSCEESSVGLLFVDFQKGTTLQLSGRGVVRWKQAGRTGEIRHRPRGSIEIECVTGNTDNFVA